MADPNFVALWEFRQRWKDRDEGDVTRTGRFTVPAAVRFESSIFEKDDDSHVTILCAGYEDGSVDIEETHVLNQEYLHLHFEPQWQSYAFDDGSGALIVTGTSKKVGGDYTVTIEPSNA